MAENINIGGRLHSTATGNVVAGANEIQDDTLNKKQSEINNDVITTLITHNSIIQGLNSQNYESYSANEETTSIDTVLPRLGVVNTIYRLGNWDGNQYDITQYAEYAWKNTGIDQGEYVLLDVKNYGIDDEPTAGSDNLVKSGGVIVAIDNVFKQTQKSFNFTIIGYIRWSDGVLVFGGYRSTAFIKVNKGDVVQITNIYSSSSVAILAAYTTQEESSYIQASSIIGKNDAYTGTYEVPEGVNYVRLCCTSTYIETASINITFNGKGYNLQQDVTKLQEDADELQQNVIELQQNTLKIESDVLSISSKSYNFPTIGFLKWSDGKLTGSGYHSTDFIKVNKGDTIEYNINTSSSSAVLLAAYSTKEESSYIQSSSVIGSNVGFGRTYIVPEGVNYIRCCCIDDYLSTAKLIINGNAESLRKSEVELKVFSKNLANPEFIVENVIIGSTGNLQSQSGWAMIKFPVEYGKTYVIGGLSTGRIVYARYGNNIDLIDSYIAYLESDLSSGVTFTPPEGATWFYCDIKTNLSPENPYSTFRINEGNMLLPYDVHDCKVEKILQKKLHTEGDDVIKDIQEELNAAIFDNPKKNSDFIYTGYIRWSDGVLTSGGYKATPFVKVKKGTKVKLNSINGSSSVAILAAYSTQEESSYIQASSVIGKNNAYTGTYEVPEGVNYVRLCITASTITENTYYSIIPYVSCLTKDDVAESITDDNDKLATIGIVKENFGSSNTALRLYPQTKLPCVSFEFDDIPSSDADIVSLFKSYNLTCGFAFIGSVGNIQSKASTYLEYQKQGFQILNHSVDGSIFNRKILTITSISISEGSGTIVVTSDGTINLDFSDLLNGSITKHTGSGDDSIAFSGITYSSSSYTFTVSGVTNLPSVGDEYYYMMSYAYAQKMIITAKNRIENAGMICNGFVSPSSTMATEFLPILKSCQAYAFTSSTTSSTANGRQQNTCELHRYGIQGDSVGTIKTFIDNCIANDQIITFYGHAASLVDNVPITNETTTFCLDKIAAIIEYCISKRDAGLLYIGGSDDCVKYFFDL